MEKTEETGNVGWTVQCRHSISKAVQESAHLYNEWQTYLAAITQQPNLPTVFPRIVSAPVCTVT